MSEQTFAPDAESLIDVRIRGLLERYASLVDAKVRSLSPHLLEVRLPVEERGHFGNHRPGFAETGVLRVGISLHAREEHPDVELAVLGSPLFEQLVNAIRTRGHRLVLGRLPSSLSPEAGAAQLQMPLHAAVAGTASVVLGTHTIGRLLARVLVRAGASAEEMLVESSVFDLATGRAVESDVAAQCAIEARRADPEEPRAAQNVPSQPVERLLPLMIADLESRLAPDFEKRRAEASRALATELSRIDAYYGSLLEGPAGPGTEIEDREQRSIFEAEHARRRGEENQRHQLRATLFPVQFTEWELLVQDATWVLTSSFGHKGTITASRALAGSGRWDLTCPTCGVPPATLTVCRHDHVACQACAKTCVACGDSTCSTHAPAPCHIDGGAVCESHARTCLSCRKTYCSNHQSLCAQGDHRVCSDCAGVCAICSKALCREHTASTAASAPKGPRGLCRECVLLCEGGRNEPVGKDEVVRCASCDRHVCGSHQASCIVDGRVHCSGHLRRADRSRRLVCGNHRAECVYEPNAVLASDEVGPCSTCGVIACYMHLRICFADGNPHCVQHLLPVADRPPELACEAHRRSCNVDGRSFSLDAVQPCAVCAKDTCREHLKLCNYCGRALCPKDHEMKTSKCLTCLRLAEDNVPVELMAAAIAANDGIPVKAKSWRAARDQTATVIDVDLGWSKHLVFTVRHGQSEPQTVVSHSLFGTKRQR